MLGTVFHYAVVEPCADHADCEAQKDSIIAMHERMGYRKGGAYNGHFCIHGESWISYWGPNQATGHDWANRNLHAWCYLATVDTPVTPEAAQAAYDLTLVEPTGRDQIYPHSAFFATSCCGDALRQWIADGALPPAQKPQPQERDVILVGQSNANPGVIYALHPVNGIIAAEFTCKVGEEVYGFPPSAGPYVSGEGAGNGIALPLRFVLPHVIDWLRAVQGYTLTPPAQPGTPPASGGLTSAVVRGVVREELDKTRLFSK